MPKKGSRPEEIIGMLCRADVLLDKEKKTAEVIKVLAITDATSLR
jgi:hypothetical protein